MSTTKKIKIKNFYIGEKEPFFFICGPCVIESESLTLDVAYTLKEMFEKTPFKLIFKSSYDKANRLSISSYRGPGLEKGLKILEKVKKEVKLPILTDVHLLEEVEAASEVADMLQIPAFLCRQTDLMVAVAKTQKPINVKKGQFLSPWDMEHLVKKIESTHNKNILLTDRGTSFGYRQLIADMTAIPIMQKTGYPVCFDVTHSLQIPGGHKGSSGGQSEFIPILAKAATASGCNGLFIEVHPNPKEAKSDAKTMLALKKLKPLLEEIEKICYALQK